MKSFADDACVTPTHPAILVRIGGPLAVVLFIHNDAEVSTMQRAVSTLLIAIVVSLSGCAAKMPWQRMSPLPEHVVDNIYRGPRPDIKVLSEYGIRTVISLEQDVDVVANEEKQAHLYGIKFIHIPLNDKWDTPPSANTLLAVAYVVKSQSSKRKVYVHCKRGIDRTGYAVAAYRIVFNGWSVERAYDEVIEHGHSEFYFGLWKKSLHQLKKQVADIEVNGGGSRNWSRYWIVTPESAGSIPARRPNT